MPSAAVSSALAESAPAAPRTLTGSAAKSLVRLAWKDVSADETSFIVERSLNGSTFTEIATLPLNATTYNDSTTAPRRKYFYRVVAANSAGKAFSNTISVKTR
jgi:hypothetical protein